jgi:hypothetical protein
MSSGESPDFFPQLAPTSGFLCDACGEAIHDHATAWGQWYSLHPSGADEKERCWRFSIMHGFAHSPNCTLRLPSDPAIALGDLSLAFLLSADGLTYLLEFFVEREVDPEELCRFLMRLFVPGYEQTYRFIGQALSECLYEQRSHRAFLTQSEIACINHGRQQGRFNA